MDDQVSINFLGHTCFIWSQNSKIFCTNVGSRINSSLNSFTMSLLLLLLMIFTYQNKCIHPAAKGLDISNKSFLRLWLKMSIIQSHLEVFLALTAHQTLSYLTLKLHQSSQGSQIPLYSFSLHRKYRKSCY